MIAAPSGAGKSSLVKALMELDSRVVPSVSHTTRPPRGQELHGREYYFVSKETFDQMVIQGAFLEWAMVHGNRYGTSKQAIEQRMPMRLSEVVQTVTKKTLPDSKKFLILEIICSDKASGDDVEVPYVRLRIK